MLKQVLSVASKHPEKAGELAISFLEKVLSKDGEFRSDDEMIGLIVSGYDAVVERATERYNNQVAAKTANSFEKYHYKELAQLKQEGLKASEIAKRLGFKSQSAVSYHWGIIQSRYPELLSQNQPSNEKESEEQPADWAGYVW